MTLIPDNPRFCLKWNEFEGQLKLVFQHLYETKQLADVTLQCKNDRGDIAEVTAHKLVLSMSSDFMRAILSESVEKHPVITMDGVSDRDLNNVLEFVYLGRVSVLQDHIPGFLDTAKFLQIDGVQRQRQKSAESADRMTPLNLSKTSPIHYPEYSSPEPRPIKIEAGNASLLRQIHSVTSHQASSKGSHFYSTYNPALNTLGSRPVFPEFQTPLYNPSGRVSPYKPIGPVSPYGCAYSQDPKERLGVKSTLNNSDREKSKSPIAPASPNSSNIELFTTPSGMIVSTAYGMKSGNPQMPTSGTSQLPHSAQLPDSISPLTLMSNMMKLSSVNPNSAAESENAQKINKSNAPGFKHAHHPHHHQKSIKYTPSQVRAIVKSVDGVVGPFVPCKICQKVVKRERLRTHIYECHLVNGEKIHCPYCNVALKSKGSYRVHVWRHRNGNLKKTCKNSNNKIDHHSRNSSSNKMMES